MNGKTKKNPTLSTPSILGLFQKRIPGDDALLELARLRFRESGLGMEIHCGTGDELVEHLLEFMPRPQTRAVVHLPHGIDLLSKEDVKQVIGLARAFHGRVNGFVVHDQLEAIDRTEEYLAALSGIDSELLSLSDGPYLYIEYACGLSPDFYISLVKKFSNLQKVTACIDIGHFGIMQAKDYFQKIFPGMDICSLTPSTPVLPEIIEDVEKATQSALPLVLAVIQEITGLGKPLHFHLHDGHPLSVFSPFGVSDHLSFLHEIPIPFPFNDRASLDPMFGPYGLSKIVSQALVALDPDLISFTLEIHPQEGRLPLGPYAHLFTHWQDKTNGERMNYWLDLLIKNHFLVREAYKNFLEIQAGSGIFDRHMHQE
ncbi:MAG: hypothetical protein KAR13_03685 [Desulfobulbaceae bacterium]|nr:hypothetical protein [Desulfobulbaceae bacterium]